LIEAFGQSIAVSLNAAVCSAIVAAWSMVMTAIESI
jgi:hypothetical protein